MSASRLHAVRRKKLQSFPPFFLWSREECRWLWPPFQIVPQLFWTSSWIALAEVSFSSRWCPGSSRHFLVSPRSSEFNLLLTDGAFYEQPMTFRQRWRINTLVAAEVSWFAAGFFCRACLPVFVFALAALAERTVAASGLRPHSLLFCSGSLPKSCC